MDENEKSKKLIMDIIKTNMDPILKKANESDKVKKNNYIICYILYIIFKSNKFYFKNFTRKEINLKQES